MVNVTFYIDKSNVDKKGLSPIKANVTVNYKNITKTVDKVKAQYWNKKRQRVNKPKPHEPGNNYETINKNLDNFQNQAKDYFRHCSQKNIVITPEIVKNYFKGQKFGFVSVNFWDAYNEYLEAGKLEKTHNTNRNRLTINRKLKNFETNTGYKLTWETINLVFWDKLKEYILDTKEHDYNYLSAIADKFKAFLKWSERRKYHQNEDYKQFSAPEKEITIVSLSWDELQKLLNFEFEIARLNKTRDFFCFGC